MKDNPVITQRGICVAVHGTGPVSRRKAARIIDGIEAMIGPTRHSTQIDPLPAFKRDEQAAPTQPLDFGEGRED